MRDKRQHTLYLQTVLMKQPGPAPQYYVQVSNISRKNPSSPHFAPRKHVVQEHIGKKAGTQATEMSTLTEQWIGFFETKASRQ